MHEALLSRAALPASTIVLGLRLRPFSLGHFLWLMREDVLRSMEQGSTEQGSTEQGAKEQESPLHAPRSPLSALPTAVLICSQSWNELTRAPGFDPLLSLKMWLWRRAIRKAETANRRNGVTANSPSLRLTPSPAPYFTEQLSQFRAYLADGSLEFPISDVTKPGRGPAPRLSGTPFILRLQQWLMTHLHLSEAAAWDYPLGLAKMRWAAHWEAEGGLDVYNQHDEEFDKFVAEQERAGAALMNETENGRNGEAVANNSPAHRLPDSPTHS